MIKVRHIITAPAALFVFCTSSCHDADHAMYVIPQHFEGVAAVIYSQKKGTPAEFQNGIRVYRIPDSGILITQFDFQDGNRDDLFLMKDKNGYDTLKEYLPGKPFEGSNYTIGSRSTHDTSQIAVNFRQVITYYPQFFKKDQTHNLDSSFKYELITIGRASTLKDDSMKAFSKHLDTLLYDSFAHK
jgi:hypothetical protein